jgi:hypothetical protein
LDFVEDHQTLEVAQCQTGFSQTRSVSRIFQVEVVYLHLLLSGHEPRKRGLAHLAGADDCHNRELIQQSFDAFSVSYSL